MRSLLPKLIAVVLLLALLTMEAWGQGSIVNSKHNLSVTGPGPIKALSEDQVCIFCHTPHGARAVAPLWNRRDSAASYIPYDSPSLKAQPGQPTGSSKLCLSCHDGTIALGDLVSEDMAISMAGGATMPPGSGLIGTDLRDDHPISFPYSDSYSQKTSELAAPESWDERVSLDDQGMLQCTTCHDPHDDQWGSFMVMPNMESMLCRQCHTPTGFDFTEHATSSATWNGSGNDPWPHTEWGTVRENACMNCHRSHHAKGNEGLLTYREEEDVCFACHDGSVTEGDLYAVFNKPYSHSMESTTGVHRTGEDPVRIDDHVECVDCHNPHRAFNREAEAPFVPGVLEGVSGVSISGLPVEEAMYEYEICLKCHAEEDMVVLSDITRQISSTDLINEINPASPSFHPIASVGKNAFVPSLISPLTPSSMIYCSDCHGNDSNTQDAPQGPHGSTHEFMLKAPYSTGDRIAESPTAYALCYQCHNRESLLGDESFSEHRFHIVNEQTPCSVCHDSHGIDFAAGNDMNNAHLINFDISVVQPETESALLQYEAFGSGAGSCTLRCHGKDHKGVVYP